jgi:hypothetical protein
MHGVRSLNGDITGLRDTAPRPREPATVQTRQDRGPRRASAAGVPPFAVRLDPTARLRLTAPPGTAPGQDVI